MVNLFYENYPTAVYVAEKKIPIVTDFREYVKLVDMLNAEYLEAYEKAELLIQYFKERPEDMEKAVNALSDFVSMKEFYDSDKVREDDMEVGEPKKAVYSFAIDYPFIFSGFLHDYGINLRTIPYMHWWEFRMLFAGLSENTEIKQRIMYRSMDASKIKDKDERRRIEKIQRSIRLPDVVLTDYDIGNSFM